MTGAPFAVKNAVVCRMVGVDFETHEITFRKLAGAWPYVVNGNYVVVPQDDFRQLRELAASAIEARSAATTKIGAAAGESAAPSGETPNG